MSLRDERGVTLLEAAVALMILGLVGVAALATVGTELRGAERSRRAIEAASLAEEQLVRVALLRAALLEPLPDSLRRGRFDAPLEGYAWETAVRAVPDEMDSYDVTVTIGWDEGGRYTVGTRLYRPRPASVGLALSALGGPP